MAQSTSLLDLPDMSICVAVDTSGSTSGKPLETELHAVQAICNLFSPQNQKPLLLLPWNTVTGTPLPLPEATAALKFLRSSGGTDPSCLYNNTQYLRELHKSDLWFLFTDSIISDSDVEKFALATSKNRLHGISCVIVVFGWTSHTTVAESNISVGLATYALAPNSLFLFHDIPTRTLHLIQAKGCFKSLLKPGTDQPVLGRHATWDSLPTIQYADLANVKIHPPEKVTEEELVLDNGLVFRVNDLYTNSASEEVLQSAIDPENLKSIVMSEVLRGRGKQLDEWLKTQQLPLPPKPVDRPDIDDKARETVAALVKALHVNFMVNKSPAADGLDPHRSELRAAHEDNWRQLLKIMDDHRTKTKAIRLSNKPSRGASKHSSSIQTMRQPDSHTPMNVSMGYDFIDEEEVGESDEEWMPVPPQPLPIRSRPAKANPALPEVNDCFLPGFKRLPAASRAGSEFVGKCYLCHRQSVLAILISRQYAEDFFGPPNSRFPYPANPPAFKLDDISIECIFSSVVCDACAPHIVRGGVTQHGDKVSAAIALVSAKDNQAAWLDVLDLVFRGAVKIENLFAVSLAVLESKESESFLESVDKDEENGQWAGAIKWMKGDLKKAVESLKKN